MDIPFELHIALRYLLAKRKQAFISVISLDLDARRRRRRDGRRHRAGRDDRPAAGAARSHPRIEPARVSSRRSAASTTTAPRSAALRQMPHVIGAAPDVIGQGAVIGAGARHDARAHQGHRPGARTERHRRQVGDAVGEPRRARQREARISPASCWARISRRPSGSPSAIPCRCSRSRAC